MFGIDDALMLGGAAVSMFDMMQDTPKVDTSRLSKFADQFLDSNSDYYKGMDAESRRVAIDGAPTLDSYLQLMRSQGLGSGMAQRLSDQSRIKATDQAMRQSSGNRFQGAQLGLSALQTIAQVQGGNAQMEMQKRSNTQSFANNMIGLGGGMMARKQILSKLNPNPTDNFGSDSISEYVKASGRKSFMDNFQMFSNVDGARGGF